MISINLAYTILSVLNSVAQKKPCLKIRAFSLRNHRLTLQSKPTQLA